MDTNQLTDGSYYVWLDGQFEPVTTTTYVTDFQEENAHLRKQIDELKHQIAKLENKNSNLRLAVFALSKHINDE